MSRFITLSLVYSSLLFAGACSDPPEDEAAAATATTQEDPRPVAVAERPAGPAVVTPAELVVRRPRIGREGCAIEPA